MSGHPLLPLEEVVGKGPRVGVGLRSKVHADAVGPGGVLRETWGVFQELSRVGGRLPVPRRRREFHRILVGGEGEGGRLLRRGVPGRVGAQPHPHPRRQDGQHGHRHQGGFPVVEGPLHPPGHVVLPEGGGEAGGLRGRQMEEGPGVAALFPLRQSAEHPLVAGGLQVPAEKFPGDPQRRVEPVEGDRQEKEGLPQKIPPAQVEPLMGQHIAPVGLTQPRGQVDAGRHQTQHEGRSGLIALPHAEGHPHSGGHGLLELPLLHHKPAPQSQHPRQPQEGQHRRALLRGDGGFQGGNFHRRVLRQGLPRREGRDGFYLHRPGGLGREVLGGGRLGLLHRLRSRRLQEGRGAPHAGKAHRAHHPEEHHRPQQQPEDRRGLPLHQHHPQDQHHESSEPGGEAHPAQVEKDVMHHVPRFRR